MKSKYKLLIVISVAVSIFLVLPGVTQNCSLYVFPDGNCFVNSYHDCNATKINMTSISNEGDPVFFSAQVIKNSSNTCYIEYVVDYTQDPFGSGKVHKYLCQDVKLTEYGLSFWCDDKEKGFRLWKLF